MMSAAAQVYLLENIKAVGKHCESISKISVWGLGNDQKGLLECI